MIEKGRKTGLEDRHVFPARLPTSPGGDTVKGRYGRAGNGAISSRTWKEDVATQPTGPTGAAAPARARPSFDLRDPQGRRLDYLRLSVTDRCNLRCRYCMPADGVALVRHADVLSLEDLHRLAALLADLGVRKIRVTGGEPLVRRGVLDLLARLGRLPTRPEVLLTTNGVRLDGRLDALRAAGVRRVNLSLDSLDRDTYRHITRRDELARVRPLLGAIPSAGLGLKINVVVLPGVNDGELGDFVALTRDRDLDVRFIEPMPFAGAGGAGIGIISGDEILDRLRGEFALTPVLGAAEDVAELYTVAGHHGRVGVIRGHARTFCGPCGRLRLDARGRLRTCLYGETVADLGRLLRDGADDGRLARAVRAAVADRLPDGRAAERGRRGGGLESMARIGG
jgi:cyclic pyranopterin phosphate synthase